MPYPAHLTQKLEKKYGPGAIYGFKKNHPEQFRKALRTAQSEGKGHVIQHGHSGAGAGHEDRAESHDARHRRDGMMKHTRKKGA